MRQPESIPPEHFCPVCEGRRKARSGTRSAHRPRSPTQAELEELYIGGSRPSRSELRNATGLMVGLAVLVLLTVLAAVNWSSIRGAAEKDRSSAGPAAPMQDETVDPSPPRR